MIDKDYIEELRALSDKKEAKAKLFEYAAQFGISVKKTKSFDNIVIDIEEALNALANEPLPETDGLSITDLITAADDVDGVNFTNEEVKEEAILLFDSPAEQVEVLEVVEQEIEFDHDKFEEAIIQVVESEKEPEPEVNKEVKFVLPENFSPTLIKLGKGPGYVTVPWWIYQWIAETPDWKSRPTSFEHASAHQTLFSLIYYINRDGSVLIRETRNSSFVTLK
ncbi:prohead protease inhibitor [Escherichia phage AlbertHofmann]|nr:prohead protease inhibitor [Escherichia phage AlbertHofmann]